jgi:hypothetical protein
LSIARASQRAGQREPGFEQSGIDGEGLPKFLNRSRDLA